MATNLLQANRQARIKTPFGGDNAAVLTRFTAVERLSEPFTITADVIVTEGAATLHEHLGGPISIEVAAGPARSRAFHGRLWEIAELDSDTAGSHYRLTLKPWASFLDINIESRIYQAQKVDDIAKDVTGRRSGIGPRLRFSIGSFPALEYCVQWQESDFDFISRLFERHGIYYYFKHSPNEHEMVATDQKSHHVPVPGIDAAIEVRPYTDGIGRPGGAIWSFARRFEVAPHMATVTDFDFLTPTQKLKTEKTATLVSTMDKARLAELHVHPGGFTKATGDGRGAAISAHLVEAARADAERCTAEGDAFAAAVGHVIAIKAGPTAPAIKYLIVATTHVYAGGKYRGGAGDEDELTVQMELIPATVQFRPAMKTPRPRIYGPQTAIVAGAAGEEIDTDKHGRIKVHFHWDRVQDGGATSSCWIRVAQSVAGAKWGAFVLPRIGQEVVVEFLNGDPDAPLVTGAVYNGQNEVPYPLPANKTRSTFKSRSTPQGSGFNELRIEDKANSEEVFFNAEKDLNSIIDKGNETRTLNKGNRTTTLKLGNEVLEIKQGNRTTTIDVGNDELTIKTGNQTVKINMGKHLTDAAQSIELKCGASSLKLEPAKITMASVNVEIKGTMSVKTQGVMVNSEASGIHVVKGSLVQIN
ncbi:type VI secretion system Vgr family protein [Polymorphobacter fuscus]|uniref:Type VI secretion system tip protein VgrG n=1 Tax=Sandarakinorhabdus fusca TaxID=1439888 RepID=A0A7C9GMX4_9SPHN|nr:type VI secretion system tip protein TssI/VgrG [Polymorphobacter fuscus]KAB7648268.1 type VI secretion system tip protein VgrG [Polymorphobacter fuscus]MQT15776.1 type VI secretion system tip protein VgrG [Polymorphobacter fuscus]NJC07952.1 type VI secretion system secreted protein VgrG [Polymorphobacter fuscus]